MISRGFRFNMNMYMFSDPCGGIESVRAGSNCIGMVKIDNGYSEWLD